MGKGGTRAEKGYNNMDHIDKTFYSTPSFKKYQDLLIFLLQTYVDWCFFGRQFILTTNKVKVHTGFHYLLSQILIVYFDSFGIEYIRQEILGKIKHKSITHNIFKIQSDDTL